MKMILKDGLFKDTSGKEIAYKQIKAPVQLNGFEYEVNVRFTDSKGNKVKLVHELVESNIDIAELVIEASKDDNGKTWYNPFVVLTINGKEQKLKPNLTQADVFILCVYLECLKGNKR